MTAYSFTAVIFGVWLGHKLTMKAFAHVQPSAKDMMRPGGSVTQDSDYFEDALKEPAAEVTTAEETVLREAFEKTGLPEDVWDSYKKSGRHPKEFFGYDVPYCDPEEPD